MDYKTNLANKIDKYNLENKFYVREITRGKSYYNANHIKYMFSPKKEKIVIAFDKKNYAILFVKGSILKFECSCRATGYCEHYIPSILYLKDHCQELDDLCCVDDMSLNVTNMNAEELFEYLSRIVGPHNLLISSLVDDFECNMEKMLSKLISQKTETELFYKIIVMLEKIDNKPLKLNYQKRLFDLINIMRTFSWEYNIQAFTYISSQTKLIKIINTISSNTEENNYINVINFIINIVKQQKENVCYEEALRLKLDYLQLHNKEIEFENNCLYNLNIKDVKFRYMKYQMEKKNYDNIIKYYENDKNKEIKELYYEALIHLHPNVETANKIINEFSSIKVLKMLFQNNLVKDEETLNRAMVGYTEEDKCEMYEAMGDYERLLDEASNVGLSLVMKYSKPLFENYKKGFIPYFERTLYAPARRGYAKEVIGYLRVINGYKFGGYYVKMFLECVYEEYITYDERRKYEVFESELNI